ncbi:hypothetical protein NHX12_024538, partial [Muraenolepis orangiensis]
IPNQRRLVRRAEVDQHMLCWQNLLTAQSLELTHLINSLDQEAVSPATCQSNGSHAKKYLAVIDDCLLDVDGEPHSQVHHEAFLSTKYQEREEEEGAGLYM